MLWSLKTKKKEKQARQEDESNTRAIRRNRGGGLSRMRRRRGGQTEQEGGQEGDVKEEEEEGSDSKPSARKSKKQLMKEAKKKEKAQNRKAEEARRDQKKERDAKREEARLQRDMDREERELREEEEQQKRQEQQDAKAKAEYDEWAHLFSTEEAGSTAQQSEEEVQNLLNIFIDYIKEHKVVVLEDLAEEFSLPAQEAIQRVEDLMQAGRLTGVIDDRGKFIYITVEELEQVAKFIKKKGRVSIAEITSQSNKMINLDVKVSTSKNEEKQQQDA